MRKKFSILTITLFLTIIVFIISTYVQKQLIHYEPTVKCLILKEDILENEKVSLEKFDTTNLPASLFTNGKVVQDFSQIEGLYAKDNIYGRTDCS